MYNVVFSVHDANNVVASTTSTVSFVALPTGYVYSDSLIWMPISSTTYTEPAAATLCAGTIGGLTGWRLPTLTELTALYTAYPSNSPGLPGYGVLSGNGWTLYYTWSSTARSTGVHYVFILLNGVVDYNNDTTPYNVTCVR
jgi:hypothetical protein